MRRLFLFFLLLPLLLTAAQDPVPFNGLVVDAAGNPVKKVRLWTSDPHAYATTDKKGRFGFSEQPTTDTLYVKYNKEVYKVALEGRQSIKITLINTGKDSNPSIKAMEEPELMDLGYGYVNRRERLNASNGISGARLKATGAHDVLSALRGLVPGLDVKANGEVTIRGVKTFMGSSQPLFLVDGVQVYDFDGINLNDVESVEVMKDASIYGSRGANGAILVTTKH